MTPSRPMITDTGNTEEWAKRFLHILAPVADEDRVIHLELGRVRQQLLSRVVHRQSENHEIVLVLLLKLDQGLESLRGTDRTTWPRSSAG